MYEILSNYSLLNLLSPIKMTLRNMKQFWPLLAELQLVTEG